MARFRDIRAGVAKPDVGQPMPTEKRLPTHGPFNSVGERRAAVEAKWDRQAEEDEKAAKPVGPPLQRDESDGWV